MSVIPNFMLFFNDLLLYNKKRDIELILSF